MKTLIILLFSILSTSLAYGYRPPSESLKSLSDTSIYHECLWNKEVLDKSQFEVDCNDLFNHYKSKNSQYEPQSNEKVRLGSYNIFRSYEQQQKRWDLTAKLIDSEWDVVALSELQPNKSSFLQSNVNAVIAKKKSKITAAEFKKAYSLPSYLKLLVELQKEDPSWSLIISPYTQSDADTELFGFVYRANQVRLKNSKYCSDKYLKDNLFEGPFIYQEIQANDYLVGSASSEGFVKSEDSQTISDRSFVKPKKNKVYGCTLSVSDFGQENFPKVPFVANFESDKFDFSYISLHLGFRGPKEIRIKGRSGTHCKEACQKHTRELVESMLKTFPNDEERDNVRQKMKLDEELGKTTSRQMVRFFQLHETMKTVPEIKDAEKDQDVIIGGDFNRKKTNRSWQALVWDHFKSLAGDAEVLIDVKTSISETNGYASNYDHFILSDTSGNTDECSLDSALAIDFLDPELTLSNGYELGSELKKYNDASNFQEITDILTEEYENKLWVSSQGDLFTSKELREATENHDGTELRSLQVQTGLLCDARGIEKLKKKVWLNLADAMINETFCKLHSDKPYLKYMATLSDHIPISMTCSANKGD